MNDYIKRNDAIQAVENTWINGTSLCNADKAKQKIANAPSADVVEVVRCKDCKWFIAVNEACGKCSYRTREFLYNANDDYCSYGERKE